MAKLTEENQTKLVVLSPTLNNGDSQLRIVLLGSGEVGKTALVCRLLNDLFVRQYIPTVEDSYRYLAQLPDGRFKSVEILDTSGTHQFPAMRDLSIKSGQAFIVVYSIESRQSFDDAISLLDLIQFIKRSGSCAEVPIALVGNKLDLASDTRVVSSDEVSRAAGARQCSLFAETSAKMTSLGRRVDEIIGELLMPLMSTGKHTRGASVKITRGTMSSRKRLGRSQSAAVFSVGAALNSTVIGDQPSERKNTSDALQRHHVKLQQPQEVGLQCRKSVSGCSQNEVMLYGGETGRMQGSRCIVL